MKKTDLFKSLPKLDDNMVGKKKNWPIALEKAKEFFKLSRYLFILTLISSNIKIMNFFLERTASRT